MNETELAEYARKKGLYVEQIKAWKDACMNANGGIAEEASGLTANSRILRKNAENLKKNYSARKRLLQKQLPYLYCQKKQMRSGGIQEDE